MSDHRSKVHGKARSLPLVDPVGTAIENASSPSPMNATSQCWHLKRWLEQHRCRSAQPHAQVDGRTALNADLAMFVDRVRIIQHKRVDAVSYG